MTRLKILKRSLLYYFTKFDIFNFLRHKYLFFTHHKYLIRSYIYFRALEKHLESKNINDTKEFHDTFSKYWVRSKKLGEKWWKTFFILLDRNLEEKNIYENFLEFSKKLDPGLLTVYEWLELYNFCMFLKLTELGLILRNLSVESALKIDIKKFNPLNRFKLGALVEQNKYNEALMIVDKLSHNQFNPNQKKLMIWFINLLKGEKISSSELFEKDEYFLNFNNILLNKKIALITSKKINKNITKELNEFDLIGRYNIHNSQNFDFSKTGNRTDISVLVNALQDFNKETNISKDIQSFIFYDYLKFRKFNIEFKKKFKNVKAPYYLRDNFTAKLLISAPNSQLRTILLLLMFDLKKIKIFNSDMVISLNYEKDYEKNIKKLSRGYKKKFSLQGALVNKCPFFDFIITKRLYQKKLIDCDNELVSILSKSLPEYAKMLQTKHFTPFKSIRKNFVILKRNIS